FLIKCFFLFFLIFRTGLVWVFFFLYFFWVQLYFFQNKKTRRLGVFVIFWRGGVPFTGRRFFWGFGGG
ncbi:hypothetical protein ACVGXX_06590, partial [Enterobacter intestinihominis]